MSTCAVGRRKAAIFANTEGDVRRQARQMARQRHEIRPKQVETLKTYKERLAAAKAAMEEHQFECMECS